MSAGELLRSVLASGSPLPTAAEDRVRPNLVDTEDPYPYIAFVRSNVVREMGLNNTILATTETFNLFCWGEAPEDAQALEEQVLPIVIAAGFAVLPNESDGAMPEVAGNCVVMTVAYITTPTIF